MKEEKLWKKYSDWIYKENKAGVVNAIKDYQELRKSYRESAEIQEYKIELEEWRRLEPPRKIKVFWRFVDNPDYDKWRFFKPMPPMISMPSFPNFPPPIEKSYEGFMDWKCKNLTKPNAKQ